MRLKQCLNTVNGMQKAISMLFGLLLVSPACALQKLDAELLMRWPAALAHQGVAKGENVFFTVSNTALARHARRDGREIARWQSVGRAGVSHMNSCVVTSARELLCANSNYPELPMAGSLEWFDASSLRPIRSRPLGSTDGSLVWVDELANGWVAGFAHYDGRGGKLGKSHRATRIVQFDTAWAPVGSWLLPDSVLERMQPYSASGGSVGPKGLLYVSGHDRPEIYALARPEQGSTLVHVATIALDIAGQAFAWDRFSDERIVWAIHRPDREVRTFCIPEIEIPNGLSGFDAVRLD